MGVLASRVAGAAFFALFPAFYFYHFAVAEGVSPEFLAGWHGPMTVVFVVPLTIAYLLFMEKRRLSIFGDPVTCLSILLLAYATAWLLINIALQPDHPAHAELAATILALGVYFLLGALFDPEDCHWWLLPCWLAMLALALSYVSVGPGVLMTALKTEAGSPLYQGLARSMMIVSMAVVALQRGLVLRMTLAVLSVAALFVLGARSELYGFLIVYGMVEFFADRKSAFGLAVLGLAAAVLVLITLTYFDVLSASRQMLVFDLDADQSWRGRIYFNQLAVQQMLDHPFFGVYGGHWQIQEGGYAHNALSAWVSLGVCGFLLYIGLFLLTAWRALSAILADPHSPLNRLAFMLASSSFLLIIVAKPVFWAVPALAWGLNTRPVRKRLSVGKRQPA